MQFDSIDLMFRAKSVVLVGISANPDKLTGSPLRNLLKAGFKGAVYLVNPRYKEIGGFKCFASISELPEIPDVALILLPAKNVSSAIHDLGRLGAKAAIVLSSGFEESNEGSRLAAELLEAAKCYDMAVIGPNCEGIWSVRNHLLLALGSAADRDTLHHAPIGIISQSGSIAGAIARQLQSSRFGCSYLVSVGNETCIDALEVLRWMIEQDDVRVVLLFIEGLRDGSRLIELARRARNNGKAIVALKSGNSSLGQIAIASHTGKIASSGAIYKGIFRQAGIIQVEGISELVEAAEVLTSAANLRLSTSQTSGVAIFSIPGGTRALTVDLCEQLDIPVATFQAKTEEALSSILPEFAYVKNPTDLTGQVISHPGLFTDALNIVASDTVMRSLPV